MNRNINEEKLLNGGISQTEVVYLKTCAIILMLIHHFWGFPSWVLDINQKFEPVIHGLKIEIYIGVFGQICVSIYAFLTGYIIYENKISYMSYRHNVKKSIIFLVSYWSIYFPTLAMGYFWKEPLPSLQQVINNMFGLQISGSVISCSFAWYVSFYICIMLLTPIILRIPLLRGAWKCIILNILIMGSGLYIINRVPVLNKGIIHHLLEYGEIVIIGYIISKYRLIARIKMHVSNINKKLLYLGLLFGIAAIVYGRVALKLFLERNMINIYINIDCIFAPLFIVQLVILGGLLKPFILKIKAGITLIAKLSVNIWFIHSIFFTPNKTIQYIAYVPHYGILIIIWVMLLLIPVSLIFYIIQQKLISWFTDVFC